MCLLLLLYCNLLPIAKLLCKGCIDARGAPLAELCMQPTVLFVLPGDKVYNGQVVGEHNRDNDLTVNITRQKHLTNMRVAFKEQTVVLKAARKLSLEAALEYIEDDELVEVTPENIRLRKVWLDPNDRKRNSRAAVEA